MKVKEFKKFLKEFSKDSRFSIENILFKKAGKAIRLTSIKQVELFERYFKQYYHNSMKYKTLQFKKEEYDRNMSSERKKYRNTKYK